jgi:hypothetical protein
MIRFYIIDFLVIFIIIPQNAHSLFLQPVLELINPTGNLSCAADSADATYNDYDLCAIRVYTSNNSDEAQNLTIRSGIWFTNTFRQFIKTRNCEAFSGAVDTGMSRCNLMSYETANTLTLCICATSNCNEDLNGCEASIKENSNVTPLPSIMSILTETIECANASESFSSFSPLPESSLFIDDAALEDYFQNHSVLCTIIDGSVSPPMQRALIEENYQSYLTNRLHALKMLRQLIRIDTPIQTDTNIYVTYTPGTETFEECACTQSSACNYNISTCATTNSTQSSLSSFTDFTSMSTTLTISITTESATSVTMTTNSTAPTSMTINSIITTAMTSGSITTPSITNSLANTSSIITESPTTVTTANITASSGTQSKV